MKRQKHKAPHRMWQPTYRLPNTPNRRYIGEVMLDFGDGCFCKAWGDRGRNDPDLLVRLKFRQRRTGKFGGFYWDPDRNRMHCEGSRRHRSKMIRCGWFYHEWHHPSTRPLGRLRKQRFNYDFKRRSIQLGFKGK